MINVLSQIVLTPVQTSLVIALQRILQASGLVLVCPQCRAMGSSHVRGDVSATTPVWRLTCDCAERVLQRADVTPMDADGALFAEAQTALRPIRLAVRCAERTCVDHPVELIRTPDLWSVTCSCAKTTFKLLPQTRH